MKHTTSTDLRKNLSAMMDRVNDDHEPVIVTRAKGKPVVMISLEDYQAMDETAYLLATPANRAALMAAISESDPSRMVEVSMDYLRAMERE
ncbi:antitoxin YefM [Roseovarius azorensis]|uniref:Antitoxin n=1 Tax=Roseovarius azorensis TaxID=1287727 RepID=A0A1H7LAT7_9RHOB|nr:type II toxin-antitoxin system prevent-host-death family antitoxin [Roseovarius azorensis]SEK95615.1 antitoxin YefM [Roseovarius azorensis]